MKTDSLTRKPRVVVVGGSFAGLCTIRHLRQYKNLDITLVEPKDYFEYTPGALHLLAGSNGDLLSPISDVVHDSAAVVHGKFFGLSDATDSKSIIVKLIDVDGMKGSLSEIPYDAIVICSGVPYTAPIRASSVLGPTLENRLLEIDDYNQRLRSASRVIISGGGLVGVELAAEISCRLENEVKEVLLISRSTLLGSLPEEAGKLALKWLNKRKNVKVYLGDEIVGVPFKEGTNSDPSSSSAARGDEPGTTMSYHTLKGKTISGDLFIDCTGRSIKITSPLLDTSATADLDLGAMSANNEVDLKKDYVWPYSKNGLIAVDEHLMAVKYPNAGMFAAGDVVEHFLGVGFASTTQKSGAFGQLSNAPSGPMHGIVVFNDLVLGGVLFGMIGGFIKYVVERSKIAEIRNKTWGRAFWAFGHIVVNAVHVLHVFVRGLLRTVFGGGAGSEKKAKASVL